MTGGGRQIPGIESDQSQFRPIVPASEKECRSYCVLPGPCQPYSFVSMTVESKKGMSILDKAADSYRSDIHIKRNMVDHPPIESRAVEIRFIRGGMEKEDRLSQIIITCKLFEILSDRRISRFIGRYGD